MMMLQTHKDLGTDINRYGCYLMSILYHVGWAWGKYFGVRKILSIKETCVRAGFIRDGWCFILDADGVFRTAGLNVRYTGVHESPDRRAGENEIEILCFQYGEWRHFVAGASGRVIYDPMGTSSAVSRGSLISKRIFKIVQGGI